MGSLWFPWSFCAFATPSIAAANFAPTFCWQCVPAVADRGVCCMQLMTAAFQAYASIVCTTERSDCREIEVFIVCSSILLCLLCEDASKDATRHACELPLARCLYSGRSPSNLECESRALPLPWLTAARMHWRLFVSIVQKSFSQARACFYHYPRNEQKYEQGTHASRSYTFGNRARERWNVLRDCGVESVLLNGGCSTSCPAYPMLRVVIRRTIE